MLKTDKSKNIARPNKMLQTDKSKHIDELYVCSCQFKAFYLLSCVYYVFAFVSLCILFDELYICFGQL